MGVLESIFDDCLSHINRCFWKDRQELFGSFHMTAQIERRTTMRRRGLLKNFESIPKAKSYCKNLKLPIFVHNFDLRFDSIQLNLQKWKICTKWFQRNIGKWHARNLPLVVFRCKTISINSMDVIKSGLQSGPLFGQLTWNSLENTENTKLCFLLWIAIIHNLSLFYTNW